MKNKFFSMFDYLLILVVLTLVSLGVMFIYSSGINSEGIRVTNEYIKQIIWASIGFVIMIGITVYDYRRTESLSIYAFIGLLLLLIYVPSQKTGYSEENFTCFYTLRDQLLLCTCSSEVAILLF